MAMRKLTMLAMAVVLTAALCAPVLGMTVIARGGDPFIVDVLAPIKGKTSWYGGAAMPIRIHVSDADHANESLVGATVTLWVNNIAGTGVGKSRVLGNNFTELGQGDYMFILDTRPYPAGPGSESILITMTVSAPDERTQDVDLFIHLN